LNIYLQSSTEEDDSGSNVSSQVDLISCNSDSDHDLESSSDSDIDGDFIEVESSPNELLELYAEMESTRFFDTKGFQNKSREFVT
jgi:hypothetical protein